MSNKLKNKLEELLSLADVKVNGERPWDIHVNNKDFYKRLIADGSLGFGESYMDGWWESQDIPTLTERMFKAGLSEKVKTFTMFMAYLRAKATNLQRKSKSYKIGEDHYDIGNELYQLMLDKRMCYTCGYWKNASNLDEAQEHKLDLICRKIGLKQGMKVLDIGCGWGSFAKYAAEKYGAEVVGITVSNEQVELGSKMCSGLPVKLKYQDYRDIDGEFDRIVSLGMFEHVGVKNYRTYMKVVHDHLKSDGLFLLHTIGGNISELTNDAWVDKYIFPNSMLPSIKQIANSFEGLFIMEDWHNFGLDYSKTLRAWYENFEKNWPKLKVNYSDRFYRMWKLYLQSFEGYFRSRTGQLWQIVLSKKGVSSRYQSVR